VEVAAATAAAAAAAAAATAAAISVVASLSSPRSSTSGEQLKSAFALLLGEHVPGLFGFLFFYTPFFFWFAKTFVQ